MMRWLFAVPILFTALPLQAEVMRCEDDKWCVAKDVDSADDPGTVAWFGARSSPDSEFLKIKCAAADARGAPLLAISLYSPSGQSPTEVDFAVFKQNGTVFYLVKLEKLSPSRSLAVHPKELFALARGVDDLDLVGISWGKNQKVFTSGAKLNARLTETVKACGLTSPPGRP